MQAMGRSMDWRLEDNMVDCLFFCVTLTGRRGGHAPFVRAGAEASNTCAEVEPDLRCSWEGHSGKMGAGVRDKNAKSHKIVQPLLIPLVVRQCVYVVIR